MAEQSKTEERQESGNAEVYVVTAPLVRFKTLTPDGVQVRDFYAGAVVPGDADQDAVRHHIRTHQIRRQEVPKGAAHGAYEPQDGDEDSPDELKANPFQGPQAADMGTERVSELGTVKGQVREERRVKADEERVKREREQAERELDEEEKATRGSRRRSGGPGSVVGPGAVETEETQQAKSSGQPQKGVAQPPASGSGQQAGGSK